MAVNVIKNMKQRETETERDKKRMDRKATFERNIIERLCVKRDEVEEREREKSQHLWYSVNL